MSVDCIIGGLTVLHDTGSPFVAVSGNLHSEQLDLEGWQSRLRFYRGLCELKRGKFAGFHTDQIKACERAIEVLS